VPVQQLKKFTFNEQYENPLFNSLTTFIEPFPIGLCHHADFRGSPEEKGAFATGTITLAGTLIEPVPAISLKARVSTRRPGSPYRFSSSVRYCCQTAA
jgi:hypothetical protein